MAHKRVFIVLLILTIFISGFNMPVIFAASKHDPYMGWDISMFDGSKTSSSNFNTAMGNTGGLKSGDWLLFKEVDFSKAPETATLEVAVPANYNGQVEIRMDKPDGKLVCVFDCIITNSWNDFVKNTSQIQEKITGVHDIYLLSKAPAGNFRGIKFYALPEAKWKKAVTKSEYKDISQLNNSDSIRKISGLNLMKGYADNTFRPNDFITRAEMSAAIAEMMGLGNNSFENATKYSDVKSDYWASQAINAVSSLKLIEGSKNGRFGPEDPISVVEVERALVCVLGYRDFAESMGGYPNGYISKAAELGLMKGIENTGNKRNMTRSEAVDILCNTIESDMIKIEKIMNNDEVSYQKISKKDGGILAVYCNIFKDKGIIESDGITSLTSSDVSIKNDEVLIEGKEYKCYNFNTTNLVGQVVDYYYKVDDEKNEKVLLYARPTVTNTVVQITDEELMGVKEGKLEYEIDKKIKDLRYNTSTAVIFNEKAIENIISLADVIGNNFSGSIKWIDNNGDNIGDVVFVYAPIVIKVKGYSENEGILYGQYGEQNIINVDINDMNDKYILEKEDGTDVDISKISSGDVITGYQSINQTGWKFTRMILSSNIVKGKIDEMIDDKVIINGTEYKLVPEYMNVNKGKSVSVDNVTIPYLGMSGRFTLDALGRIAAADDSNSMKKAVVVKFAKTKGINAGVQMKMFTEEGKMVIVNTASKIELDGEDLESGEVIYSRLTSLTNSINGSTQNIDLHMALVRYSLDSDGKIRFLDTPGSRMKTSDDVLKPLNVLGRRYMLQNNYASLGNYFGLIPDIIFLVPHVGSDAVYDDSLYSIVPANKMAPANSVAKCVVYNMGENDYIGRMAVVQGPDPHVGNTPFYVSAITDGLAADGSRTKILKGFYNGADTSFKISLDSASTGLNKAISTNVVSGSILRPMFDAYGNIVDDNADAQGSINGGLHTQFLSQNEQCVPGKDINPTDGNGDTNPRYVIGKVIDYSNGFIKVWLSDKNDVTKVGSSKEVYRITASATILVYDYQKERFKLGTVGDIVTDQTADKTTDPTADQYVKCKGSKVFIYLTTSNVSSMAIYR